MPTFRKCYDCGRRIEACFGFGFATDWLLALYGIIPWALCRERCGVCVERHASIDA